MSTQTQVITSASQNAKWGAFKTEFYIAAAALLILTAVVSALISHETLLWNDELLVLWSDSVPSLRQLNFIQQNYPVSLHPVFYHSLVHTCIRIFGQNRFAVRFPSLTGFLLMQLCILILVNRASTKRAALVAAAIPVFAVGMLYSADATPYGLLLGLYGLAMICWQEASRCGPKRSLALIGLAASIALALNSHYYGVLLLVPLCAAETFRSFEAKKIDPQTILALALGMSTFLLTIPSLRAASEFRASYLGRVGIHSLFDSYNCLLPTSIHTPIYVAIGWALLATAGIAACQGWRFQIMTKSLSIPGAEIVLLTATALLPVFGYVLARFVTHAFEIRYVLGLMIGVSALLSIGLSPRLRSDHAGRLAILGLLALVASLGVWRIYAGHNNTKRTMSALRVDGKLKSVLATSPGKLICFQDSHHFAVASYYEPDPEVQLRLAFVYSRDQEMKVHHSYYESLTALHLKKITNLNFVSLESLEVGSDQLFVTYPEHVQPDPFTAVSDRIIPVGPAFGGQMVNVSLPAFGTKPEK